MSCPQQGNIKRNGITSLGLLPYSCKKFRRPQKTEEGRQKVPTLKKRGIGKRCLIQETIFVCFHKLFSFFVGFKSTTKVFLSFFLLLSALCLFCKSGQPYHSALTGSDCSVDCGVDCSTVGADVASGVVVRFGVGVV